MCAKQLIKSTSTIKSTSIIPQKNRDHNDLNSWECFGN